MIQFFTLEPNSKCFDVSMYKPTSDFEWAFGHCSGSDRWHGPGTYTDKCCISDGWNILTCSIRSYSQRDWSNSILIMLGHQFCDDFVGYKAFIRLNVSGDYEYEYTAIYLKITVVNYKPYVTLKSRLKAN